MAERGTITAVTSASTSGAIGRYGSGARPAGFQRDAGGEEKRQPEQGRYDVLELTGEKGKKGRARKKEIGLLGQLRQSTRQLRQASRELALLQPQTTAPNVLALPLQEAMALLQAAGLPIARLTHEHSRELPKGSVLIQVPGPGAIAHRDLGMALVVSKGPGET